MPRVPGAGMYFRGVKIDGVVHICMRAAYRSIVGERNGKTLCDRSYKVANQDPDNCWLGQLDETVVTCVMCASKASFT